MFLKQGILWEFQKLFRRLRYLILEHDMVNEIEGSSEQELIEEPIVESI